MNISSEEKKNDLLHRVEGNSDFRGDWFMAHVNKSDRFITESFGKLVTNR